MTDVQLTPEQQRAIAMENLDQIRPRWWRMRRDGIGGSFGVAPEELSSVMAAKKEIKQTLQNIQNYLFDQLSLVEATEKDFDVAGEVAVSPARSWPNAGVECEKLEDNVWRCGHCGTGLVLPLWAWQCNNCDARVSLIQFYPLAERRYFKHHAHRG